MNTLRIVSRQVRALTIIAGVISSATLQVRTAKKRVIVKPVGEVVLEKDVTKKEDAMLFTPDWKTTGVKTAVTTKETPAIPAESATTENTKIIAQMRKNLWKSVRKKRSDLKQKAAEKRAAVRKNKEIEKTIKSSGAVNPYTLFVQRSISGNVKTNLRCVAAAWKALSEGQKKTYRDQAKKNLAARNVIKQSLKSNPSQYALFMKKHFAAAFTEAQKTNPDSKAAFKVASEAVAKKYKVLKGKVVMKIHEEGYQ